MEMIIFCIVVCQCVPSSKALSGTVWSWSRGSVEEVSELVNDKMRTTNTMSACYVLGMCDLI